MASQMDAESLDRALEPFSFCDCMNIKLLPFLKNLINMNLLSKLFFGVFELPLFVPSDCNFKYLGHLFSDSCKLLLGIGSHPYLIIISLELLLLLLRLDHS